MKKHVARFLTVAAAALVLTAGFLDSSAHARAGGGRSFGSRGTRSYSQPASPYSQPAPARPQVQPSQQPLQQPAGGGFLRSMAGGVMGGMLGGMLFRSLGFGGTGDGMGGGIGLFEILLVAGIGYMIFRMVKKRREEAAAQAAGYDQGSFRQSYAPLEQASDIPRQGFSEPESAAVDAGLAHIRQMDGSFDESRFNDGVMDMFFKIQGAWMNRDLAPAAGIMTDEMRSTFQDDIDRMVREKRVNRLENIAVRNVEIVEAWQESGQDFITALIYANLLDYTTDDVTGQVVAGSRTEPVKFEEYWTFSRPVGNNPWKLSGIDQK